MRLVVTDHKKATKLDDNDRVRLENLGLRLEVLNRDRDAFGKEMAAKYGTDGGIAIAGDGTIQRPPIETAKPGKRPKK
jgi:hypothetical protein